jgi:hypothetical protein
MLATSAQAKSSESSDSDSSSSSSSKSSGKKHFDFRFGVTGGSWRGSFTQSGLGTSTNLNTAASTGGGIFIGGDLADVFPIFVDFTAVGFGAPSGTKSAKDAAYAGLGVDVGYTSRHVPFELYVGDEIGGYAFATGTKDVFKTNALLAGANLVWRFSKHFWLGLKGEYRWMTSSSDSGGDIPPAYTTKMTAQYLGLYLQLSL